VLRVLLPELRRRHLQVLVAVAQPHGAGVGTAAGAQAFEHVAQGQVAGGVQAVGQRPVRRTHRFAEEFVGSGVGFFQLVDRAFKNQHRLGGHLEQQPVARLDLAQAPSSRAPFDSWAVTSRCCRAAWLRRSRPKASR